MTFVHQFFPWNISRYVNLLAGWSLLWQIYYTTTCYFHYRFIVMTDESVNVLCVICCLAEVSVALVLFQYVSDS